MKLSIILFSTIALAFDAMAQYKIEVETLEKEMSKGSQTAFTVLIPESKTQDIETRWNKYVNNRSPNERFNNFTTQIGNVFKSKEKKTSRERLKMNKTGDELHIRSIGLDQISSYPMDIYAIITPTPEGSQLSAFFQYTDSVFIDPSNTDPDRLDIIAQFVREFGVESYRSMVEENIKLANRDVSKEEGVLKGLHNSILRAEKAILRDQILIQEYKTQIAQLRNDSANMVETIAFKNKEISAMHKDSLDYQVAQVELKAMEREKSRVPREIRNMKGRIKSKELAIESARNQIAANEIEIQNQEAIIQEKQQITEEFIRKKGEIQ